MNATYEEPPVLKRWHNTLSVPAIPTFNGYLGTDRHGSNPYGYWSLEGRLSVLEPIQNRATELVGVIFSYPLQLHSFFGTDAVSLSVPVPVPIRRTDIRLQI